MVVGTPDVWDECIHLSSEDYYHSYTWSPCGRFVAAGSLHTVEIRDPLSSELLSTLTPPNAGPSGKLAYSPDGRSIASPSWTSLIIWDIQTGGVAKEIERSSVDNISLAWSLDGGTIAAIFLDSDTNLALRIRGNTSTTSYVVRVYDVASGTISSPGTFQSRTGPQLWAHGASFKVLTGESGDQHFSIETFEVGSTLTKDESFRIEPRSIYDTFQSFSPTTYRFSISNSIHNQVRILDIRKSEYLLKELGEGKHFGNDSHCFSPDGGLFATSSWSGVHIWKYTYGRYTPWRNFPPWTTSTYNLLPPQFSPTSSSILGRSNGPLQVWILDGPPSVTHLNDRRRFAVLSYCGTYIATGRVGGNIVTITNLHSRTPPQLLDTNMTIGTVALTGNVLLVCGSGELVAWRLTEKGMVNGVSADRMACRGDSIWIVSNPGPWFSVGDQTVVIEGMEVDVRVYHTGTGEVLEPAQASPNARSRKYSFEEMQLCQHYPNYHNLDKQDIPSEDECPITRAALEEGWVNDLEGKHRLWIPLEWRVDLRNPAWLRNTALLLNPRLGLTVVVML